MKRARKIGLEAGLKYVYMGNAPTEGGDNTACPACGKNLIDRVGFVVRKNRIQNGKCPACGFVISGLDMSGAEGEK
ncbi:MAG: hypothetical protein RBT11_03480 [Desulfobacterales bacterium]|nr:hypothetical protein [Desulfobacterales bacterium]